jgi:hypothetical protein
MPFARALAGVRAARSMPIYPEQQTVTRVGLARKSLRSERWGEVCRGEWRNDATGVVEEGRHDEAEAQVLVSKGPCMR